MFRKMMFALCVIAVLNLLGGGQALAGQEEPTWETAFDPGEYMAGDYYVMSVEEYKENLYVVAAGAEGQGGRLFRSPDGKIWEAITEAGFGLGAVEDVCGTNYYDNSWDMAVFREELYLLPFEDCYIRPGLVIRTSDGVTWETVVTATDLGITWPGSEVTGYGQFHKLSAFQGMLYVNIEYYDPVAEFTESAIYRSPHGDPGTWEEVISFPGWGYGGTFHVFKGALYEASDYIYTPPYWEPAPDQIWRTFDGTNWEMVVGDGFGNPGSDGLGAFADYKGYLYVGAETGEEGGAQIWRSLDGVTWEQVDLEKLLSIDDFKVDGLNVYQGKLYAHINNGIDGVKVIRTKDGSSWQIANVGGFGNPDWWASHHTADQAIFKDELYMGMLGYHGVLLKMVHPDK